MSITISTATATGASGTTTRTKKFAVKVSLTTGTQVLSTPAQPSAGNWSVTWTLKPGDYVAMAGAQTKAFTVASAPPPPARLYPTSAFWQPVDPTKVDANSPNFLSNFLAQGQWAAKPQGTELTSNDWTRPFYVAKSTDPTHTIQGGMNGSYTEPSIQGNTIHVPAGARPSGGQYSQQLDGSCVILQPDGKVYSAWRSVDPIDGRANQWAMIDSNGSGSPSGNQAGIGQAKMGPRMGQITYDELVTAGEIPHALFFETRSWHGRRYPGLLSGGGTGGLVSDANALPMAGHMFLTYSPTEINALNVPVWKKVIARALSVYGMYSYDNGGSAHSLDWESGTPSLLATGTNKWTEWAKAQGIPGHTDSSGHTIYAVDIQSGIDWSRLRVLQPPTP